MLLNVAMYIFSKIQSCLLIVFYVLGLLPSSALLIGYYHGLLLRDINVDPLIVTLYSAGLLTTQGLNMILFGHSFHHRSLLLLECIRHMDSQAVLAFSELLKDIWPQIGMQLVTGIAICTYVCINLCIITTVCICLIVTYVHVTLAIM